MFSSLNLMPQKRIAICYYGLTRSVKRVYRTHEERIFSKLKESGIDYDIFVHTWKIKGTQRIREKTVTIPVDYQEHKLLKPDYYTLDDQNQFLGTLALKNYFYREAWIKNGDSADGEWPLPLLINHLCALESQKRVLLMVENSSQEYDYVMFIRPDVMIKNDIPVSSIKALEDKEILIPNFAHNEGYNDRFAVLRSAQAGLYAKRIDETIGYRQQKGRIVAEKYVKAICDKYSLRPVFIDFYFGRVRP